MEENLADPLVSVLMPVFNGAEYLAQSIESILSQTYKNFEFLIIDDGSTDDSLDIIKRYSRKDIRVMVVSRSNKGLADSLNEGLDMAKGKYIARQDADDVSDPRRLQKQVQFMDHNPSVSLLGTNYSAIDADGQIIYMTNVFTRPKDLKLAEILSNQFGHGSIMIRKEILKATGVYKKRLAEDYDLFTRIARVGQLANLKEPLYNWRSVSTGLSTSPEKIIRHREDAYRIRDREFNYYLKHKKEYNLFSFGLTSTLGGVRKHLEMKNRMLRDMSLMYCYRGLKKNALLILLLALVYAPWVKKSYRQLLTILLRPKAVAEIEYEYI